MMLTTDFHSKIKVGSILKRVDPYHSHYGQIGIVIKIIQDKEQFIVLYQNGSLKTYYVFVGDYWEFIN